MIFLYFIQATSTWHIPDTPKSFGRAIYTSQLSVCKICPQINLLIPINTHHHTFYTPAWSWAGLQGAAAYHAPCMIYRGAKSLVQNGHDNLWVWGVGTIWWKYKLTAALFYHFVKLVGHVNADRSEWCTLKCSFSCSRYRMQLCKQVTVTGAFRPQGPP